ncbi:MAG: AAA family ATPase [Planctomycetota bacterium]
MDRRLIRLSDVKREDTAWLWPERVPLGSITLLDGDPGQNKNTFINEVAARLTTGRAMYGSDEPLKPGGVILLDSEEPPSKMREDLEAAGADLAKIVIVNRSTPSGDPLTVPDDCQLLEKTAADIEARLIVLSPLTHFLGASINSDQAIRRALAPLQSLAERLKLAVIAISVTVT